MRIGKNRVIAEGPLRVYVAVLLGSSQAPMLGPAVYLVSVSPYVRLSAIKEPPGRWRAETGAWRDLSLPKYPGSRSGTAGESGGVGEVLYTPA